MTGDLLSIAEPLSEAETVSWTKGNGVRGNIQPGRATTPGRLFASRALLEHSYS